MLRRLAFITLALFATACGSDDQGGGARVITVTPAPPGKPWDSLGEWHLFVNARAQLPAERVVPYEVVSPLWSDAALKHRFVYVPEGATIGYEPSERWKLPVGAILVKTFAFPAESGKGEQLIETRLLVHEPDGWAPQVYLWNAEQTGATRLIAGKTVHVSFPDASGGPHEQDYGVPNTNQCHDCHGKNETIDTLGGRTRQLNRDHDYGSGPENQIDHLAAIGYLSATPPPLAERETLVPPDSDAPLEARARSYLDANCGHCHDDVGGASQSGFYLAWDHTGPNASDPKTEGICKVPTSAGGATCGFTYDIVPGDPDHSILICRVASRVPKIQMPPLATRVVDDKAVTLLRDYITSLSPGACQ
jgi:uncharacterized repeat protein (TIGR03806 family)